MNTSMPRRSWSHKEQAKADENRLRQAARLFNYAEGWWQDQRFKNNGGQLFYAVDVDIVTMHIAPIERSGYADVFEQEGNETAELLARLIGDFIFSRQDPTRRIQLMLIPPHDEELFRMGNAISNKLLEQIERGSRQLLLVQSGLFDEFDRDKDYKKLVLTLCEKAPDLVRLFDERAGPASELTRLTNLLGQQRLQNLEHYIDRSSQWAFPVPDVEKASDDASSFTKMKARWKARLNETRPGSKPQYALETDAEVLARLEWINREVEGRNCRLVLITGSEHIFNAAKLHDKKKFSTLYIRHPRAFLADESFFRKTPQPTELKKADFVLLDWLNLFFPSIIHTQYLSRTAENLVHPRALEALLAPKNHAFLSTLATLRRAESRTPLDDYLGEWSEQVRATAVAWNIAPELFGAVSQRAEELISLVLQHRSGITLNEADFVRALYTVSLSSLNRLYSTPTWIGLWAQTGTQKEYIKGIPYLNFDMDPEAQVYCDEVFKRLRKPELDVDLIGMYKTLSKEDDSNYLAHTVHALAYATKGHWHAARTLCRVAIAVVDQIPAEEKGSRKGREAAYLAAVATRRLMQGLGDLKIASELLDEAVRRDDYGRHDLRFDSERWAIVTAKHHLRYFNDENIPDVPTLEETVAGLKAVIDSSVEEDDEKCRNWIQRQALTNLFNIVFIATAGNTVSSKSGEWSESYFDLFEEVTASTPEDQLARTTFEMAYALWGGESGKRRRYARSIITHSLPIILSFDKARQERIREAARIAYQRLK